ncbi:MAG: hypothetical protein NVS3B21_18620 [Acidimicrobiales bacterium]
MASPVTRGTATLAKAGRVAAALLRIRPLVRAPIWLFRARLGMVFGSRLILLEHTGRSTGRRRHVVLEVVARPAPDTYVVASGFGIKAQWYRNIRAEQRVRITVRSNRAHPAVAAILTQDQAEAALADYAVEHPRAWRSLKPIFEQTLGATISESGTELPLVAVTLIR